MDKNEVLKYIEVGSTNSICVDRRLLKRYPGFVRDIIVMKGFVLKIEFNTYGYDEGGLIIKIYYEDNDTLIDSLEKFLKLCIQDWKNISKTNWYPELNEDIDFIKASFKLKQELANDKLPLPSNGIKYEIANGYWRDIADGKITIS